MRNRKTKKAVDVRTSKFNNEFKGSEFESSQDQESVNSDITEILTTFDGKRESCFEYSEFYHARLPEK